MEQERLSKIMAARGLCSRREADQYIERGWVSVDGEVVDQLGSKECPDAHIVLNESGTEEQAQQATFLLNKPIGYVSGQPEKGYKAAVSLIEEKNRWKGDCRGAPGKWSQSTLRTPSPRSRSDRPRVEYGA